MSPATETFDLNELSAAAGVTPRTIRYYVQQGLLPSPGTRGPGTRYDRAHLDRLHLIRRLQRQHLPLAEIRRRLETLDDDAVSEALAAPPEPSSVSSAADYVRELLAKQSAAIGTEAPTEAPGAAAAAPPEPPTPPSVASLRSTSNALVRGARAAEPTQAVLAAHLVQQSRHTRSTWDRIPLAPDVELHVRRPLSREQNRQVERLIEAARDLFAEEP